jgi:hypothetical protein
MNKLFPYQRRKPKVKDWFINESADFDNAEEPPSDYKFSLLNPIVGNEHSCPFGILIIKDVFSGGAKIMSITVFSDFIIRNDGHPFTPEALYNCVIDAQKNFIALFGEKKKAHQQLKDLHFVMRLYDELKKKLEIAIMKQGDSPN